MNQFISLVQYQYDRWLTVDAVGYLACALVLATFSMKSMRPLRVTAIASNIAFLIYASSIHLQPILVLHGVLLPLNIFRLAQIERAQRTGHLRVPSPFSHQAARPGTHRKIWLWRWRLPR